MKTSINFKASKSDSEIYALHKDLNDYLLSRINSETEKLHQKERDFEPEQQENEISPTNQIYNRKR